MKRKLWLWSFLAFLVFPMGSFALSVSNKEIYLYGVSDGYTVSLSSEYKSSEQIRTDAGVRYSLKSGEWITVSDTGLVTIKPKVWWCSPYACATGEPPSSSYNQKKLEYVDSENVVLVEKGNESVEVKIYTHSYEKYYAEKVMKDYADAHITSSMSDYEKMEEILKLMSTTNYSVNHSDYVGLFSAEGADCWGDSYAILYMCDYVGIKAHVRNANRDSGAGSGHKNVAAVLDGKIYVVDVMSSGLAPRSTEIRSTIDGFSVPSYTTDPRFIQYDGYDEIVYIPSSSTIHKLGVSAFSYGRHDETKVRDVYVPATLTEISDAAFQLVDTLKNVYVDSSNPNYKDIDGVLYSKDGSVLRAYPSGRDVKTYTVRDGVEEVSRLSFYANKNLEKIVFPSSVKTIREKAFLANESLQEIVFSDQVTTIESKAFYETNLHHVILPESVTSVGDDAFSPGSVLSSGEGINYVVVKNPNASLGSGLCHSWQPIYGLKGSTAEQYAKDNHCPFGEITVNQTTFKDISEFTFEVQTVPYSEEPIRPIVTIKDGDYTLQEGKDFEVIFWNNTLPTDYGQYRVTGKGSYVGYFEGFYTVTKKKIHYEYTNPVVDYTGGELSPSIVTSEEGVTITYDRVSTPPKYTKPGTYTFQLRISKNNCETIDETLTFQIKGIDISLASVSEIPDVPYVRGSYLNVPVDVTYKGKKLVRTVDYNVSLSSYTGGGDKTVTITGIGIYEGMITKQFHAYLNTEYTLDFPREEITIPLHGTYQLNFVTNPKVYIDLSKANWFSYDKNVATVSSDGKITAVGKGETTVQGSFNLNYAQIKVVVSDFLKGDMDQDGDVDIIDVMVALRIHFGITKSSSTYVSIGDMNGNEKIDIVDVLSILRMALGVK